MYNKDGSKIRSMKMDSESVDYLRALRFDVNENLYSTSQSYSSIYVSTKEGENVKTIKLCGIGIPDGPFVDDNGNIIIWNGLHIEFIWYSPYCYQKVPECCKRCF